MDTVTFKGNVMFFNNGVNTLAAVDDGDLLACGGKGFFQKGLHAQAVDDHNIGLGEFLHVLGGQRVVVRAAGLGGNEQINLHIRACLGNSAG